MGKAPFRVHKYNGQWWLSRRRDPHNFWGFDTPGQAIDYAYKNWPWWP